MNKSPFFYSNGYFIFRGDKKGKGLTDNNILTKKTTLRNRYGFLGLTIR